LRANIRAPSADELPPSHCSDRSLWLVGAAPTADTDVYV